MDVDGFVCFCNGQCVDKEIVLPDGKREEFSFLVEGRPAPQGSKSYRGNGRFSEASKYLPAWRNAIVLAVKQKMLQTESVAMFDGPVRVSITFFITKPAKPKWPFPATTPDLDKLVRGVFDSLTQAKIWVDDCLVVDLHAREVWCGNTTDTYPVSGARVTISAL
jgi:crossover junction endodeoxyribonuclease RusA